MLIRCISRKQNCSMRANVTKISAAYAISRTTRNVAYIDNERIKHFFFSYRFSFKMTNNI